MRALLSRYFITLVFALGLATPAAAQVTIPYTFVFETTIDQDQVNSNFSTLGSQALNRTGGTMSGVLQVVDGTVSAPGLARSGDTNTGMWFPGADTIAWSTGGSERARISSGGLTSITGTFSVSSTSTFTGAVTVSDSGAAAVDVAGGINAGSGNVGIVDTSGKIPAISSTYFASLSGANLSSLPVDITLTRGTLANYREVKATGTISTNTLAVDLANGNHFAVALNANITTFTIANVPATGSATAVTFTFTADGSVRSIVWPSGTVWAGGVAPTMTGTNNKRDLVTLYTWDGGTVWFGFVNGQNF